MKTQIVSIEEFQRLNKEANANGKQAMVTNIEDTADGRMITFGVVPISMSTHN